jgi:hypothetical protein
MARTRRAAGFEEEEGAGLEEDEEGYRPPASRKTRVRRRPR